MEDVQSSGTGKPVYKTLQVEDVKYRTLHSDKYKKRKAYQRKNPKLLTAFIPGTIVKISIKPKTKVKTGDPLLVLEAMKMKNEILSTLNGVVKKVNVQVGERVKKDQLLIEFE